ncbi:SGNH/GDSL hydrolase family protein [Pseudomonas sp. BN414]|uniref:SGNH/GDSL hydrolase family protein n=1 Tax=Pseudomonas sp. BN414 TaxID=2567888 RepID=UPI002455FDB5|nr:SGNH/GDSL hydrolase family protein [Pseudomonas sp. BN414]MDH4569236.1 SGNH/GDSL hydrolase family protein [Pseudomonas sp. BN414]
MMRLAMWCWWVAALPLLPLALPMAMHTRRTALRLAPAAGPERGLAGSELEGEPLRLLLIGESTVAGVGASCLDFALAGQLASALAMRLRRPVAWRACGENGITAGEALERLLPQVADEPVDLVLLVFGVNDTTHFSASRRWQEALKGMAQHFVGRGAQVALAGVPPLQHFTALPWLLRQLLGWRASLLDSQLRALAEREGLACCATRLEMRPEFLALDGYHPSPLGYRVWGESLADWFVASVQPAQETEGLALDFSA